VFVIYVDKLYRVDDDRHMTEGFSDADEGYQMKDAAGWLHFVIWSHVMVYFIAQNHWIFARYLAECDTIFFIIAVLVICR